jgi:endopolyphosphatase
MIDEPAKARASHEDLCDAILDDFSRLPKAKDVKLDEYAVINVSPPVVPNPYVPTFRVFAYNVTGSRQDLMGKKKGGRTPGHHRGNHGNKAKLCKEERYRDSWKCHLNSSWHSDPEAPSRTNRLWSPLGYAQVNANNDIGTRMS